MADMVHMHYAQTKLPLIPLMAATDRVRPSISDLVWTQARFRHPESPQLAEYYQLGVSLKWRSYSQDPLQRLSAHEMAIRIQRDLAERVATMLIPFCISLREL